MNFLTAHSCADTQQLYCPPGVPIAIQATLKSGSRSAALWAAMLEGLLPALVAARRTIAAQLQNEGTTYTFERFGHEWLQHEPSGSAARRRPGSRRSTGS